jgi:hypothetical protein
VRRKPLAMLYKYLGVARANFGSDFVTIPMGAGSAR